MSKKIIGGEFRIESNALQSVIKQNMNPKYSLGRTSLYAILDALKFQMGGVLLPDYLCNSVAEVPQRIGLPFKLYHITESLLPDINGLKEMIRISDKRLVVILISYFGIIDLNDTITSIRTDCPKTIIIVDDVQNYYGFGCYCDYDYCFTSYRKWFAVPDGADVLTKDGMPAIPSFDEQCDYALYKAAGNILKNHVEMIGDSISLELIEKGENQMDEEYRYACSDIGSKLLQRIDIDIAAEKRRNNAKILHNGLEQMGVRHFYKPEKTPLFVPIILHERDRIRRALYAENIFVPIHWPVTDRNIQGNNELYKTELSLICDQRYDEEDMERILSEIRNAL